MLALRSGTNGAAAGGPGPATGSGPGGPPGGPPLPPTFVLGYGHIGDCNVHINVVTPGLFAPSPALEVVSFPELTI